MSQGRTLEEAKKNLLEIIKIKFYEMKKTKALNEYLNECGFIIEEDEIIPQRKIVGFEKLMVTI